MHRGKRVGRRSGSSEVQAKLRLGCSRRLGFALDLFIGFCLRAGAPPKRQQNEKLRESAPLIFKSARGAASTQIPEPTAQRILFPHQELSSRIKTQQCNGCQVPPELRHGTICFEKRWILRSGVFHRRLWKTRPSPEFWPLPQLNSPLTWLVTPATLYTNA